MKEAECADRIGELRTAKRIYDFFIKDPTSALFNCFVVKELLKRTGDEITRLEELISNGELDDSFKTHNGLKEEDLDKMAEEQLDFGLSETDKTYLKRLKDAL